MNQPEPRQFERWHSLATAVASVLAAMAIFLLGPPSAPLAAAITFCGVVLIGLPHGGLDHLAGMDLLGRLGLPRRMDLFVLCYLAVAVLVVAGWYLSPLFTIGLFFALSAWHFGLEEETWNRGGVWAGLSMIARGGMIIWLPCWAHRDSVVELLRSTVPGNSVAEIDSVLGFWASLLPVWVALALFDCVEWTTPTDHARRLGWVDRVRWSSLLRQSGLAVLMLVADPLISFTVYFCGWHSVRGLVGLFRESGLPVGQFSRELLPISLLAAGLFFAGWIWSSSISGWVAGSIQTTFIGLSAVAIPHLLLHVLVRLVPGKPSARPTWTWGATG